MTAERDILREVRARIETGRLVDMSMDGWVVSSRPRFLPGFAAGFGRFARGRMKHPFAQVSTGSASAGSAVGAVTGGRLPPPASPEDVSEIEALVGASLPGLLRDLYAEANGGFGPGYGLLGLRGGFADDLRRTAVDIVTDAKNGMWPGIPNGLVPLCHWGCAIYSFVHCPSGQVYGWDPNPVEPDRDVPFFAQDYHLEAWVTSWLDGTLRVPELVDDAGSQQHRGAAIDEPRAESEDI